MAFTRDQLRDMFTACRAANDALGTAASKLSDLHDYFDPDSEIAEWHGQSAACDAIAWRLFDLMHTLAGLADARDWIDDALDRIGDKDWAYILERLPPVEVKADAPEGQPICHCRKLRCPDCTRQYGAHISNTG